MSFTGADWEVAMCFPSGDRRETPTIAAQSWPGAQHQGRGKSKKSQHWASIVFTQQLCCWCTCGVTWPAVPWLQDDSAQRKQMKALITGALYRNSESDRNGPNSKRTVHRGCHTGTGTLTHFPKRNWSLHLSLKTRSHAALSRNWIVCCFSEDTVMSESTSSMSDSTSHDNGESICPLKTVFFLS